MRHETFWALYETKLPRERARTVRELRERIAAFALLAAAKCAQGAV